MLCKWSSEASSIWKFWGLTATALLSAPCLRTASLLHHARRQLPPRPQVSQRTFQDAGRIEGERGTQPAKANGDFQSSAAPDLRLGLLPPRGWGQLRRTGVSCAEGPLGTKTVRIANRPATVSEQKRKPRFVWPPPGGAALLGDLSHPPSSPVPIKSQRFCQLEACPPGPLGM